MFEKSYQSSASLNRNKKKEKVETFVVIINGFFIFRRLLLKFSDFKEKFSTYKHRLSIKCVSNIYAWCW